MNKSSLLISSALLMISSIALAGSSTIVVKDANGTNHTYDVITDGSGNFVGMFGVCDGSAAAQCAAVKAASTTAATTDPAIVTTTAAGASGGWTASLANALSTTVKSVKSSGGQLAMLQCYNPNSSQAYIQIFNVASGSVSIGTTTPTLSIPISAISTGGWALANPGIAFSTAISMAATTTATGSIALTTAVDCNAAYN